jgi:hypothetical protein
MDFQTFVSFERKPSHPLDYVGQIRLSPGQSETGNGSNALADNESLLTCRIQLKIIEISLDLSSQGFFRELNDGAQKEFFDILSGFSTG